MDNFDDDSKEPLHTGNSGLLKSTRTNVLGCEGGLVAGSDQVLMITFGTEDEIAIYCTPIVDARFLVIRALAALAAFDPKAKELLVDNFPVNNKGQWSWPDDDDRKRIT